MTYNPNVYSQIIFYSLISGVILRLVYDTLTVIKTLTLKAIFISKSLTFSNISAQDPPSTDNIEQSPHLHSPSDDKDSKGHTERSLSIKHSTGTPPSVVAPQIHATRIRIPMKRGMTAMDVARLMTPRHSKTDTALTVTIDLLFSVISALWAVMILFGLNYGEMRWFVFPLLATGYALYTVTFSRPFTILVLTVTNVALLSIKIIIRSIVRLRNAFRKILHKSKK